MPIIVDDDRSIEVEPGAVVGGHLEGVASVLGNVDVAVEAQGEVVAASSNPRVELVGKPGAFGFDRRVKHVQRLALLRVVGEVERSGDDRALEQEVGDVAGVLAREPEVRHPTGGADAEGVLEELFEARERVLLFHRLRQRHGGFGELLGLFPSRGVTRDAPDLVELAIPPSGRSEVRRDGARVPTGSRDQPVGDRLRVPWRSDVGHRGAGLGPLRVGDEALQRQLRL